MSKPVVLIAERDAKLRRRLFAQLLCQGFDVITAPRLMSALRILRHRRDINVFIVSASLETPGDGVVLARLTNRCQRAPQIILIAEKNTQEWKTAAQEAGVAAYFEQPCSWQEVLASVQRCCTSGAARKSGSPAMDEHY
ncbi:MAG TPA: response regulator [Methylomirabilota bacterium]|nr:response regulator [Methylomirabilota bacterium]